MRNFLYVAFTFAVSLTASPLPAFTQENNGSPENQDLPIKQTPRVVLGCAAGAKNIYDLYIDNNATEQQADTAYDNYYKNCMCASNHKPSCNN